MWIRKVLALLCIIVPSLPADARPLFGFTVNADAGVAPLVVFNNDSVGFRVLVPLGEALSLESTTSLGFTVLGLVTYMTSTYPPDPGVYAVPWFHGSEELEIGFPVRVGTSGPRSIALRLHPVCLAATWTPFYFFMIGAGIGAELEYEDTVTGVILRPIGIFARVNWRPSVLGFHAVFQAGMRFSMLW